MSLHRQLLEAAAGLSPDFVGHHRDEGGQVVSASGCPALNRQVHRGNHFVGPSRLEVDSARS
jgi:hypothetical protein